MDRGARDVQPRADAQSRGLQPLREDHERKSHRWSNPGPSVRQANPPADRGYRVLSWAEVRCANVRDRGKVMQFPLDRVRESPAAITSKSEAYHITLVFLSPSALLFLHSTKSTHLTHIPLSSLTTPRQLVTLSTEIAGSCAHQKQASMVVTGFFASLTFILLPLSSFFTPATSMPAAGTSSEVCFYAKNPRLGPCDQGNDYFCCQNLLPNECCSNDGPWKYCDTMGGDRLQPQYSVNFFKKPECSRGNFGQYSTAPRNTHCCSKRWNQYGTELTGELEECSMRLETDTDSPGTPVIDKRAAGASGNVTENGDAKEEIKRSVCRRPNAIGYRDDDGVFHRRVFPESHFKDVLEMKEFRDWEGLKHYAHVLPPYRDGA